MPSGLIILGGLPGAGKTTLARALATAEGAVHIRIDTIEQAIRDCGFAPDGDVGASGYVIGQRLAADNLRLGRLVIADSVNPIAQCREGWRRAAIESGRPFVEIEITCSSRPLHRRRVEERLGDIARLTLPSWEEVEARHYEPWDGALSIDTADRDVEDCISELRAAIRTLSPHG